MCLFHCINQCVFQAKSSLTFAHRWVQAGSLFSTHEINLFDAAASARCSRAPHSMTLICYPSLQRLPPCRLVKRILVPGDRVGGHVICKHKIRRNLCEECSGGGICDQHIQRHWCTECGGKNKVRCVHGHQKSKCREGCGGSAFCPHGQYKYRCKVCKAKQ